MIVWLFDPLHRLPVYWRKWTYLFVAVHVARLAMWYWIEDRWGPA